MAMPVGTITFLFTDIEGSTRLWETAPVAMQTALARHDFLMRAAIEANDGYVFKTVGDAFCAAFFTAPDALRATLASQQSLQTEEWQTPSPIRVRMALHTGTADVRDNDYFGPPLNRVSRLLATGHGEQVLLSLPTQELVRDMLPEDVSLREMGLHRLKDLVRPETVYQLCHPGLNDTFPPLRSLDNPDLPNNLPQQTTSFVGRDKQIENIKGLMANVRLLTLTGSGGCGKTRLSLQIAADLLETFPDGVWFVELAPLSNSELVSRTVASVLGIKEAQGDSLLKSLTEALKAKRLLILLDNCEHVLDASAKLAESLLKNCPYVHLLASSREGLNIAGETTYRVPSLSSPNPKSIQTVASVSQYEAVQLFLERALASKPDFVVTAANAPAIAQLCSHLDGIPLTIELAAARVKSLSVEEINRRLDQRFRLLTGGSRTALPRQQTLRSLIDWSYDLLNTQEKVVLQIVSVFSGGWTAEAAEFVCTGDGIEEWEVLDILLALVEKSLVTAEESSGTTRYRLLESIRQYAHDRLTESASHSTEFQMRVQARHLAFYQQLVETAEEGMIGAEQTIWVERLEMEHDNIRAALRFGITNETQIENTARLCGGAGWLWNYRGYWSEGREWCAEVIKSTVSTGGSHWAKVFCQAGRFALYQGDFAASTRLLETSLTLARESQEVKIISITLNTLGNVAYEGRKYETARTMYEECLSVQPALGENDMTAVLLANLGGVEAALGDMEAARAFQEQALVLHRRNNDKPSIALSLENLGVWAASERNYEAAYSSREESVRLNRETGNKPDIAYSLRALGSVAYEQGNREEARTLLRESLMLVTEVGANRLIPDVIEYLAMIFIVEGDLLRATRLLAAMSILREQMDIPRDDLFQPAYEERVTSARTILGEDIYLTARLEGSVLTREQAMELAITTQADY